MTELDPCVYVEPQQDAEKHHVHVDLICYRQQNITVHCAGRAHEMYTILL
jgi:hypothetical protein